MLPLSHYLSLYKINYWRPLPRRKGEQNNQKTDLTEKTRKKLPEKTEPVKKTDWTG
jgi:hypothetical protein